MRKTHQAERIFSAHNINHWCILNYRKASTTAECSGLCIGGNMHLEPVDYVIRIFKGVRAAGRAAGRHGTVVSKWKRTRTIPQSAFKPLLISAAEKGLDLKPEDLIFGREIDDVA